MDFNREERETNEENTYEQNFVMREPAIPIEPIQPIAEELSEKDKKKKSKKERRQKNTGSHFFRRTIAAALIFGMVGGATLTGVSYAGYNVLGLFDKSSASQQQKQTISANTTSDNKDYTSGVVSTVDLTSLQAVDASSIVSAVMPSIVAISNYSTTSVSNFFGQSQTQETQSAGSGIIVAQDDTYIYIATNNHVVSGADSLTVQFNNGVVANATVKGTYEGKDLAVVKVALSDIDSDTQAAIKIAQIGDSKQIQVGQTAIAIGNALGYGQSVTCGVISAVGREVTAQDSTTGVSITNSNLIQTDAAINPGNSGGALLNASGQVIGINSAKYSDTSVEGFGFAIPMEDAWPIIQQLISREKVDESQSAYLGVQGQDISSSVAEAYNMPKGVYVYNTVANSPAAEAGIVKGDVITKFDGQNIYTMQALKELISYYSSGTTVTVVVARRDSSGEYKEVEMSVTLGSASQLKNQTQNQQKKTDR